MHFDSLTLRPLLPCHRLTLIRQISAGPTGEMGTVFVGAALISQGRLWVVDCVLEVPAAWLRAIYDTWCPRRSEPVPSSRVTSSWDAISPRGGGPAITSMFMCIKKSDGNCCVFFRSAGGLQSGPTLAGSMRIETTFLKKRRMRGRVARSPSRLMAPQRHRWSVKESKGQ